MGSLKAPNSVSNLLLYEILSFREDRVMWRDGAGYYRACGCEFCDERRDRLKSELAQLALAEQYMKCPEVEHREYGREYRDRVFAQEAQQPVIIQEEPAILYLSDKEHERITRCGLLAKMSRLLGQLRQSFFNKTRNG